MWASFKNDSFLFVLLKHWWCNLIIFQFIACFFGYIFAQLDPNNLNLLHRRAVSSFMYGIVLKVSPWNI